MAPSIVASSTLGTEDCKVPVKNTKAQENVREALEAARARFVANNPKSLKLHERAVKSLPGGNTRSLLHTAPFPVFLKKGEGYRVTSEDDTV